MADSDLRVTLDCRPMQRSIKDCVVGCAKETNRRNELLADEIISAIQPHPFWGLIGAMVLVYLGWVIGRLS